MRAVAQRLPFHYGWFLVLAAVLCNTVSNTSTFWAVTMWIPAIAEDLGAPRTPVVTAFMAGQAVSAGIGPFIGRYVDRHGARAPLLAGAVLLPAALTFTSFAGSLPHLYLGWCLVGVVRGLAQPIPFNWLMTRWFAGRQRQSAIGIVTVGFSLGGAVLLPLLASIQHSTGWPVTMRILAVLILVLQGTVALVFVRDHPSALGMQPSVGRSDRALSSLPVVEPWGFTAGAALRSMAFWLLGIGLMLFFMGQGSVTNLGLDFFQSRGVEAGAAVFAAAATIRTIARLPLGATLSRYKSPYRLGIAVTLSQSVALAALLLNTDTAGIGVFVILWGIGGAFGPMLEPLFITHVFGVRHFGAVSGSLQLVSFFGQLVGSIGGAALFDLTGSYSIPYWTYTVGFGLSAFLLISVRWAERRPRHIATAIAMGRDLEPPAAVEPPDEPDAPDAPLAPPDVPGAPPAAAPA